MAAFNYGDDVSIPQLAQLYNRHSCPSETVEGQTNLFVANHAGSATFVLAKDLVDVLQGVQWPKRVNGAIG